MRADRSRERKTRARTYENLVPGPEPTPNLPVALGNKGIDHIHIYI